MSIGGARIKILADSVEHVERGEASSIRFEPRSAVGSDILPLAIRNMVKVENGLIVGCRFMPADATHYRLIADLIFANSDQWSAFQESRRTNIGIIRGTFWFVKLATIQSGRGIAISSAMGADSRDLPDPSARGRRRWRAGHLSAFAALLLLAASTQASRRPTCRRNGRRRPTEQPSALPPGPGTAAPPRPRSRRVGHRPLHPAAPTLRCGRDGAALLGREPHRGAGGAGQHWSSVNNSIYVRRRFAPPRHGQRPPRRRRAARRPRAARAITTRLPRTPSARASTSSPSASTSATAPTARSDDHQLWTDIDGGGIIFDVPMAASSPSTSPAVGVSGSTAIHLVLPPPRRYGRAILNLVRRSRSAAASASRWYHRLFALATPAPGTLGRRRHHRQLAPRRPSTDPQLPGRLRRQPAAAPFVSPAPTGLSAGRSLCGQRRRLADRARSLDTTAWLLRRAVTPAPAAHLPRARRPREFSGAASAPVRRRSDDFYAGA